MDTNTNEVLLQQKPQTNGSKSINKYKYYNLLFSGKISMNEYLDALRSIKDAKRKN